MATQSKLNRNAKAWMSQRRITMKRILLITASVLMLATTAGASAASQPKQSKLQSWDNLKRVKPGEDIGVDFIGKDQKVDFLHGRLLLLTPDSVAIEVGVVKLRDVTIRRQDVVRVQRTKTPAGRRIKNTFLGMGTGAAALAGGLHSEAGDGAVWFLGAGAIIGAVAGAMAQDPVTLYHSAHR
ncbi:MAG: hypothetical protein HYX72_10015 [Acidobacteria bacterium]|nr:hypothetical protein [Acidobacteriota bacterium]